MALLNLWKWWSGANEVSELEIPSVDASAPYLSLAAVFKVTVMKKFQKTEGRNNLKAS